jgi:predicted amidohydrolase YtcJ
LRIANAQDILSADIVSVSGSPANREVSLEGQGIDQSVSEVLDDGEVGITVEYKVKAEASERELAFKLLRHALNGCIVRIYHVVGEQVQLVYEVDHHDEIGFESKNTLDFTLDLNTMTVASTESNPKPPVSVADAASVIFYNGQVLTMDENMTQAEALAIQDGTILAVGGNDDILALRNAGTQVIDLQGLTLLPGFIDGHTHILISPDRMGQTIYDAMQVALSWGYTSVTEMVGEADYIERLQQVENEGRLKVRVNVFTNVNQGYLNGSNNIIVDNPWYLRNAPVLDNHLRVRVPGVKIFVDGAGVPGRGCPAMSEPYSQESQSADWFKATCFGPYGDLYWKQEELNQAVATAQDAGFRVAFHAMGDQAIEDALDAIEFALDGNPNKDVRHQIQHSSILRPDLMDRYISLDILSSLRGYFNTCDQGAYENEWAANRYSLPGLGVHSYLESDFGWTVDPEDDYALRNGNPIIQLYGLVTHKQVLADGRVCEPAPWLSRHVITVEQALRIMTIEPAYAVSQEEYLGSLEPGKFADIIILSDNPLTIDPDELKDIEVLVTIVAGQTEYCLPGEEVYCP